MNNLLGKRVLITGVGIKPVEFIFKDIVTGEPSHTPVFSDDIEYKANIGAATALECAKNGAIVHLVARTEEKIKIIKKWIEDNVPDAKVEYSALDLSDINSLKKLVASIPDDIPLYWVQSAGIGAGTVNIKDNQPYTAIEDSSEDQLEAELSIVKNTFSLLKILLPRFYKQSETRICVVTSLAAVRSFTHGAVHCGAKGALSRFVNAAMLDLDKKNIFLTDIRPGIVDTGGYDREIDKQCGPIQAGANYGYDYTKNIFTMPALSVGKVIADALILDTHITSINMVARGQWPHEAS